MLKVQALHSHHDISIETIALRNEDVFNDEPHTHAFWEIGFFEAGMGAHTIDFIDYPICPGTVYFLKKGIVHSMFRKKGSHGKVILFSDTILSDTLLTRQLLYAEPHLYLQKEKFELFQQLVSQLYFFLQEDKIQHDFTKLYLQLILSFFATHANKAIAVDEKVHLFLQYVETHFSAKLTVEECATQLNISYQQLHAEVQKKLHKPPFDIIKERIILQAKRLLFNTQESIKEIAYSLDFEDSSYFSKYFKTHTGLSPIEFREISRAKATE